MCGVAGYFSRLDELPSATKVLNSLNERGPDGKGVFYDNDIWLYHSRLAINDLTSAGNQPMRSKNTGNVLIFNGEIYNFRELIKFHGLESFLQSRSDAEVLLALVDMFGPEKALSQCEGMYAFALWNPKEKTLVLCRDRFGQKPLFYIQDERKLVFGSTPSSVEETASILFKPSRNLVMEYLLYGFPLSSETIKYNVREIEAGTINVYGLDKNDQIRFLKKKVVPTVYNTDSKIGSCRNLDEALISSVNQATNCDHSPVLFLSGGVDSNLLFAICNEHYSERISAAVTLHFEGSIRENEASRNAQFSKIPHINLTITDEEYVEHLKEIVKSIDEPIGDVAFAATSILSKEAKKYSSVILSGDGADEIFGGYNRHIAMSNRSALLFFSLIAKSKLGTYLINKKWPDGNQKIEIIKNLASKKSLNYLDFFQVKYPKNWHFDIKNEDVESVKALMNLDTRYYLKNNILRKTDRATMTNSVEGRLPFLFNSVTRFASDESLISGVKGKIPLRNLLKKYGKTTSFLKRGLTPKFDRIINSHLSREYLCGFENIQDLLKISSSDLNKITENNDIMRWRIALFGI